MKTHISFAAIALVLVAGCSSTRDDRAALDRQEGFVCSPPGKAVYEAWGPNGLSKACTVDGKRNGSFFTAEQGHVVIRGSYENGNEHGIWEWLDSSGNVVRRGQGGASGVK